MRHTYMKLYPLDPELLHLVQQRRVADPEQLCRLGPAPPGPFQRDPDQLALEFPHGRLEVRPFRGDGHPDFAGGPGIPPFGGPPPPPHPWTTAPGPPPPRPPATAAPPPT